MAKIVSFDIETSHLEADFGRVLNFAWKEVGKPARLVNICDYEVFEETPWNDKPIVMDAYRALMDADVIVSFYGKLFDEPYLNARGLYHKLELPMLPPHVDLYFTARRVLKISSRGMGNVADQLRLSDRKLYVPHDVWVRATAGSARDIRALGERCKSDVRILEEAYLRLRGSIRGHPSVSGIVGPCRYCGGTKLQRRGYHLTTLAKKQRVQCQSCGAWDTRKIDVPKAA